MKALVVKRNTVRNLLLFNFMLASVVILTDICLSSKEDVMHHASSWFGLFHALSSVAFFMLVTCGCYKAGDKSELTGLLAEQRLATQAAVDMSSRANAVAIDIATQQVQSAHDRADQAEVRLSSSHEAYLDSIRSARDDWRQKYLSLQTENRSLHNQMLEAVSEAEHAKGQGEGQVALSDELRRINGLAERERVEIKTAHRSLLEKVSQIQASEADSRVKAARVSAELQASADVGMMQVANTALQVGQIAFRQGQQSAAHHILQSLRYEEMPITERDRARIARQQREHYFGDHLDTTPPTLESVRMLCNSLYAPEASGLDSAASAAVSARPYSARLRTPPRIMRRSTVEAESREMSSVVSASLAGVS